MMYHTEARLPNSLETMCAAHCMVFVSPSLNLTLPPNSDQRSRIHGRSKASEDSFFWFALSLSFYPYAEVTPWPEKPVTIGYNESATYTTKYGHYVVRSANYYLDQFCTADPDNKHYGTYWGYWQGWEYYNVDPVHGEIDVAAGGRPELVIGGCANMWGEHVDATNFMPRVWPRTSTMAERFWSAATVNDSDTARPRLHEFRCKMVRRGIPAEPIASLSYNEGGPYHVAFCKHDSDWYEYRPPQPWYNGSWAIYPKHV
eukprot:m.756750 g.756750  ORF g.756750 m.756750 type:complete len:258 (+) comp23185_c0_seq2:1518-2291(+)